MKKILFIHNSLKTFSNLRGDFVSHLIRRGYDGCAALPYDEDPKHISKVRFLKIELSRTSLNPISDLLYAWRLRKIVRAEAPDIVFLTTVKCVIFGSLASAWSGRSPKIFSLITGLGHTAEGKGLAYRLICGVVGRLYRLALRKNDFVFFQNVDDEIFFKNLRWISENTPSVAVGSGVDLSRFAYSAPKSGAPVFLFVGRLIKEKGILEYVDAARQIKIKYPEARFRILGAPDLNPSTITSSAVDDWRREETFDYIRESNDIISELKSASVFVLPSYREGMSRALMEALAVGRAAIVTDVPGCREMVEHGKNGFLVKPRDVEQLFEAMAQFILNPRLVLEMSSCSRKIAEDRFDVNQANLKISNIMDTIS